MADVILHLGDDDQVFFDWVGSVAQQLGLTTEALVMTAMVRFLGDWNIIQVPVQEPGQPPTTDAFLGRWLGPAPALPGEISDIVTQHLLPPGPGRVIPLADHVPASTRGAGEWQVSLAQTRHGIAAYLWHWQGPLPNLPPQLLAFPNLDSAARDLSRDPRLAGGPHLQRALDDARRVLAASAVQTRWRDV